MSEGEKQGIYWPGTNVIKTRHNDFNWRERKAVVAPLFYPGQPQRDWIAANRQPAQRRRTSA